MDKYSKKLVIDYINCKNISNYEYLENDIEFMKQVFEISNDVIFYDCCSETLKNNYNFVFYLINKFKNNVDFISELCIKYISNNRDNSDECIELAIMTDEILEKQHKLKVSDIKTYVNTTYNEILDDVMFTVEEYEKENNEDLGLGFAIIYYSFKNSKITLDFFAKKYIDEIFFNEHCSFEKNLHKQFKEYEDVIKYGTNRFLINYINCYDNDLSSYISCNIDLLENIKIELISIKRNWNDYKELSNNIKVETYIDELERFINEKKFNISFTVDDLIKYNASKLGFSDLLSNNTYYLNEFIKEDNNVIENKKVLSYEDMCCLSFSNDLAKHIFVNEDIVICRDDTEENQLKSKIIKMPVKKH